MEMPIKFQINRYRRSVSELQYGCCLLHVLTGSLIITADKETRLKNGDWVILGGQEVTSLNYSAGAVVVLMRITDTVFCNDAKIADPVIRVDDAEPCRQILSRLLQLEGRQNESDRFEKLSLEYELLSDISGYLYGVENSQSSVYQRQDSVLEYIRTHFREPLSLSDVARHFYISTSYFSRRFHEIYGITFHDYLRDLRLREATARLAQTDDAVTKIAMESGFPNYSAMINALKTVYGKSPAEYRQSQTQSYEQNRISLSFSEIEQFVQPYLVAGDRQNRIWNRKAELNMNQGIPAVNRWNEILNAGHAGDLLRADVQTVIRALRKSLGFRYIRINSLLKADLIPLRIQEYRFSYSSFFQIISYLDEIDVIPFFDLAYKNTMQSRETFSVDAPYDLDIEFWLTNFTMFWDACCKQYPAEKLQTWKFELWLPQHWEREITTNEIESYVKLFSQVYQTIKKQVPGCQVGGPGIYLLGNWKTTVHNILTELQKQDICPDFLTCSLCSDVRSSDTAHWFDSAKTNIRSLQTILPQEEHHYSNLIHQFQDELIHPLGKNVPVYVMESASEPINCPGLNDGAYPAAFQIKTLFDLMDAGVCVAMPKYQNAEIEYTNEHSVTCGGTGLLLKHGLKSTLYYAYTLLNRLGREIIFQDKNFIVTKCEKGHYAILLHNCKLHSSYFDRAVAQHLEIPFTELKLYENDIAISIFFQLSGLTPGEYLVHEQLISDEYGCIAATVQRMNYTGVFTPESLDYLDKTSLPYQHYYRESCEESLELSVTIQSNEIILLELTLEAPLNE